MSDNGDGNQFKLDDKEVEQKIQQMQQDAIEYLSSAYQFFKHRLSTDYLILDAKSQVDGGKFEIIQKVLKMKPGNSSAEEIDVLTTCAKMFCWLGLPYCWLKTRSIFEVPANSFAFVIEYSEEQGQRTVIYGPGYHILGYDFKYQDTYSFENFPDNNIIESDVGDLKIAKVEQGYIMHLTCGGQNLLLGPGIHLINQPVIFREYTTLDSFFINIGPEKWVTIPSGYDGIAINRGQLQILRGGKQHYLSHVQHKFVKMVPKTLQTDRIPTDIPSYVNNLTRQDERRIQNAQGMQQNHGIKKKGRRHQQQQLFQQNDDPMLQHNVQERENDPTLYLYATTVEGTKIVVDCQLYWKIIDTKLAAITAMEILKVNSIGDEERNEQAAITASSRNICNLRLTVLRIAKHHLSSMIGCISLTGKSSLSAQVKGDADVMNQDQNSEGEQSKLLEKEQDNQKQFDILNSVQGQANKLKDVINQELIKIGCVADNICIYKVTPSKSIQEQLDKQTKAKVDANTAVIAALSKKQASVIEEETYHKNSIKEASSKATVLRLNAESTSTAQITKARGQANAITKVAKARKEEADQLDKSKIARNMAITRAVGDVGEQIFQGTSKNIIYGKNPGQILNSMVGNFAKNN